MVRLWNRSQKRCEFESWVLRFISSADVSLSLLICKLEVIICLSQGYRENQANLPFTGSLLCAKWFVYMSSNNRTSCKIGFTTNLLGAVVSLPREHVVSLKRTELHFTVSSGKMTPPGNLIMSFSMFWNFSLTAKHLQFDDID